MKLEAIRAITWTVPDVNASASAFSRHLGLGRIAEGRISTAQARRWNAPAVADARFVVLASSDQPLVLLRFIEQEMIPGAEPLVTTGWNAAELHVRDIDGLARQLRDSAFRIIGPPRDLLGNGAVHAMQVLGPGNELLYLTQISQAGMQRTYGKAEAEVGRPFIVVLGVRNQSKTLEHYGPMARFTTEPRPFRITVLAKAHDLDPESAAFSISSIVMEQRFRIETDAYPLSAGRRPYREGHLPAGLCLVSVAATEPAAEAGPAGDHGQANGAEQKVAAGVLVGPDGEWLECVPLGSAADAELLATGQLDQLD